MSVSDLERFKSFTAKNVSRQIAICLNGEVYAVPWVRHRFTGDCIALDLDDEGLRKIKEITDGSKARGT